MSVVFRRRRPGRVTRRPLWLTRLEDRFVPANFVVNSAADGGVGTLRQAILDANVNNEADTITFDASITAVNLTSGQLTVLTDLHALAIVGPGSGQLTISGVTVTPSASNRIFNLSVTGGSVSISISGLTLTGGNLTSGNNGGAILDTDEALALSDVTFIGNQTAGAGGAIATSAVTGLSLTNCRFVGNSATGAGGALSLGAATSVTVNGSTFSNNTSAGTGGAIDAAGSTTIVLTGTTLNANVGTNGGALALATTGTHSVTINTCTISGNTATKGVGGGLSIMGTGPVQMKYSWLSGNSAATRGGGLYLRTTATIANTTISRNTAGSFSGGGIAVNTGGALSVLNSTVVANLAGEQGGGIRRENGTVALSSTIVAQNSCAGSGPDVSFASATSLAGDNNLLGVSDSGSFVLTGIGNKTGTRNVPLDPRLTPYVTNYGGNVLVYAPIYGSPALEAGNNSGSLPFDERGTGYPRAVGIVDIGAVEGPIVEPFAVAATLPNVIVAGSTPNQLSVTFDDDAGIDTSPGKLNTGDLIVKGPSGPATALFTGFVANGGHRITATYAVQPPGGVWDTADNGAYMVTVAAGELFDIDATPRSASTVTLGAFSVRVGPIITVDSLGDGLDFNYSTGNLTLREAVLLSNSTPGQVETIRFASNLLGKTIVLGSEISIIDRLAIDGPGADQLTISANQTNRFFSFDSLSFAPESLIAGVTLSGGKAPTGNNTAVITLNDDSVLFSGVTLANNDGGTGSIIRVANGRVRFVNSTMVNNRGGGSGIALVSGSVEIVGSCLTGFVGDSAVNVSAGALTIIDSTLSNNRAKQNGGAIAASAGVVTIVNSTISGNSAPANGGGIAVMVSSKLSIVNSTISRNTAGIDGGGGIMVANDSLFANIQSTIIAQNSHASHPDLYAPFENTIIFGESNLFGVINETNIGFVGTYQAGTLVAPLDAKLAPLGYYGGASPTHPPLAGSPALDNGNNSQFLAYDQRQTGFPRSTGIPDVGSVEGVFLAPHATTVLSNVTIGGGTTYVATVVYNDDQGIDISSIDVDDVRLIGPGFGNPTTPTKVTITGAGTTVTAQYEFQAPGGVWDRNDNGVNYALIAQASQVFDTDAPPHAALAGKLGSFSVVVPALYVVDTALDVVNANDGVTSLREAIAAANYDPLGIGAVDVITFAAGLNGMTIALNGTELSIVEPVVIQGPGQDKLTIKAATSARIFSFYMSGAGGMAQISGVTLTGGNVTGAGGAILLNDDGLTLADVALTANTASTNGGAIDSAGGTLIISNSLLSKNSASGLGSNVGYGGAIAGEGKSTIQLTTVSLSENTAYKIGGGISVRTADVLTITDTAITKNFVIAGNGAGAAGVLVEGATATIINSTIAANSAPNGIAAGGAIEVSKAAVLSVYNSTIVGNTAAYLAGGIYIESNTATITLNSTIIAQNVQSANPDLYTTGTLNTPIAGNNNLFGALTAAGITFSGTYQAGTFAAPLDPKLTPLGYYGGPTPAFGLLPGSPALDKGNNFLGLSYDQRGLGFARSLGQTDIGSTEGIAPIPLAVATLPGVSVANINTYIATVTYSDNIGIDVSSIDINDVRLSGPGYATPAAPTSVAITGSGISVVAQYTFAAPGGAWDFTDNGAYTLATQPNQVFDLDVPTPHAANAATIGSFGVLVPTIYLVDVATDVDDGKYGKGQLTFREAITLANKSTNLADTITFDPAVFSSSMTILADAASAMTITDSIIIHGPLAPLTLSGYEFKIDGPGTLNVAIDHLALTDGNRYYSGGAIWNVGETLNLDFVTISGNKTSHDGAGIKSDAGILTLTNCLIVGNQCIGKFGGKGAGIDMDGGSITLTNCTISGNSGFASGGGLHVGATSTTIRNCTITNNIGKYGGGINALTSVTLVSSVIAGNTSTYANTNADIVANTVNATDSVLGVSNLSIPNLNMIGGFSGFSYSPFNPRLAPLYQNGGPMLTHAPLPDSPLIDAGSNPVGLAYDQRGPGYPRVLNGKADIGAFEGVSEVPIANASFAAVTVADGVLYTLAVTYSDVTGIDVSSLSTGDVKVTGPSGFAATPTFVSVDVAGNGSPRTAKYAFTPPGGSWNSADNGSYTISLVANEVFDADASKHSVLPGVLGTFAVDVGKNLIVDELSDVNDADYSVGHLSLREAVLLANQNADLNDLISFDPALFGGQTLTLTNGPLAITDRVEIHGPAAGLTLNAGASSRLGTISLASTKTGTDVLVDGVTLAGGRAVAGSGGALLVTNGHLLLNHVVVENCVADVAGGAVALGPFAQVYLTDTMLRSNSAGTGGGGALYSDTNSQVFLLRTTIANNTSAGVGGGLYCREYVTIDDSALVANVSLSTAGAGGIEFMPNSTFAKATLRNSTISGNMTAGSGGGVTARSGQLIVRNCTFAFNTASQSGGGINVTGAASVTLDSSIISDNVAPSGRDISGQASASNSLVSSPMGSIVFGTGNLLGVGSRLLPLANNGGATLSHLPGPGSPVRDAGANTDALANDQRGVGFARVLGGGADIGAVESANPSPIATLLASDVGILGGTGYQFQVVYRADVGIDVATLGTGDVSVSGPNGFSVTPTFISVDMSGNGSPRIATYSFAPPGGTWDATDVGSYLVTIAGGEVLDNSVPARAVPAGALGSFRLSTSLNYKVDELSDVVDGNTTAGHLSLREAIGLANDEPSSADTISFSMALFASPQVLPIVGGAYIIRSPLTLNGPGASNLTLNAGGLDRIFSIDVPSNVSQAVVFSGLTLAGGKTSGNGGALLSVSEQVTLNDCILQNNSATGGGAIFVTDGLLTLSNCSIQQNTASAAGGGVYVQRATTTLQSTTLTANTATGDGGGLLSDSGTLSVFNSTIDNNRTGGNGGGLRHQFGDLTIRGSTVAANTAKANGGGLSLYFDNQSVTNIDNSTIVGNSAATGGGISHIKAASSYTQKLNLTSCVVTNNTATTAIDIITDHFAYLNYCLIGVSPTKVAGSTTNNRPFGENAKLGPLTNNGGPTRTLMPLVDSPLMDHGSNPANLPTDQRGAGFSRVAGLAIDIGAVEAVPDRPWGTAVIAPVNGAGGTSYSVSVTWQHPVAIKVATLGDGNLILSGPNGFSAPAHLASIDIALDGSPRVATYTFVPPGGSWDAYDNGTYTASIVANEVSDLIGHFNEAVTLGSFTIGLQGTFVVTNTNNTGPGSLRDAIARSNAGPLTDAIVFDPIAFSTPQIIQLAAPTKLTITDDVTITGPGSAKLTISAQNLGRIFEASPNTTVSISGMTLVNAYYTSTPGAAFAFFGDELQLNDCVFRQNYANTGSGVAFDSFGKFQAVHCLWDSNNSSLGDGVLWLSGAGSVSIRECSLINNASRALYAAGVGSFEFINSTIGNNLKGGGFVTTNAPAVIRNSTIANNGNGIELSGSSPGALLLENSTIAGNTGTSWGGLRTSFPTTIRSSDLVGNKGGTYSDLWATSVTASYSAIGSTGGYVLGSGSGNNLATGLDYKLGPLTDNGGFAPTRAPLPGSPLLNAGSNPSGLLTDQRGYPRVVGTAIDIGAVENIRPAPQAIANLPTGPVLGATDYTLTVTYYDDVAISISSLGATDVRMTGPNGFNQIAKLIAVDSLTDGSPRTATYRFSAPGGVWDHADDGAYTIALEANQVVDTTLTAVPATAFGTINVAFPQSLIVTTDADNGAGSLRAVVAQANAIASADLITFDPAFFNVPRTITLTSGDILISDGLTIAGPDASLLTISGNKLNRIFRIDGPGTPSIAVSGLTFRDGSTISATNIKIGGAIFVADETLVVSSCVFQNNTATLGGGAIAMDAKGVISIEDTTFTNNVTLDGYGGAVDVGQAISLTISRASFTGNIADDYGGAVSMVGSDFGSSLLVADSLMASNTARHGGGLYIGGGGLFDSLIVQNTTISGNTALEGGGGMAFNARPAVVVQNSTIVGNQVIAVPAGQLGGGGIERFPFNGTLALESTIVAGNVCNIAKDIGISVPFTAVHSAIGSSAAVQLTANSHDNLPYDIDLKLGPLTDNGGPTLTHALLPDSPCISAGSNSSGLINDQRGTGFLRTIGIATDIGAYEAHDGVAPFVPPATAEFLINAGDAQRSQLTTIDVKFSHAVTFPNGLDAAIHLNRIGPGGATGAVSLTFAQSGNTITLSFGSSVFSTPSGSLIDGKFQLVLSAADISGGEFDGNGDGTAGDNLSMATHRLFGDSNGDGTVNGTDFLAFRLAFLGTGVAFDFDDDGQVTGTDFLQFRLRFLQSI